MNATQAKILVVEDDVNTKESMKMILDSRGYSVETAETGDEAVALLDGLHFDLAFVDLKLPDTTGIILLERIKRGTPETAVILVTAHGSVEGAIEAIKKGAFHYIEKPFRPDEVLMHTRHVLGMAGMWRQNQTPPHVPETASGAYGIVGRNSKMCRIRKMISTAATSDASVLIEGESGTGKELIARAIHSQGERSGRPFISINCAAIPGELIESELFGCKRGAFTGAAENRRGLIEAASGGTLFLDEIGEMPPLLQAKLLRVLQERRLRRLGEVREVEVDFRLICATNRDVAESMRLGMLRDDLFYRISTIRIKVPPLRERLDDLELIAGYFVQRYSQKYNRPVTGISEEVLSAISDYSWPGNVRELENVIEHAVLFCRGDQLVLENLPEEMHETRVDKPQPGKAEIIPFDRTMREIERQAIERTLNRCGGNIKRTAEVLDVHRQTLYRKLKAYNIAHRN